MKGNEGYKYIGVLEANGILQGSVAEWLERWACNSEAPSSSPAPTASWIYPR